MEPRTECNQCNLKREGYEDPSLGAIKISKFCCSAAGSNEVGAERQMSFDCVLSEVCDYPTGDSCTYLSWQGVAGSDAARGIDSSPSANTQNECTVATDPGQLSREEANRSCMNPLTVPALTLVTRGKCSNAR